MRGAMGEEATEERARDDDSADGPAVPVITGTSQGVYRVTIDGRSGAPMVVPPVIETGAPTTSRGDLSRRPLSLPAFADAVRRAEAAR